MKALTLLVITLSVVYFTSPTCAAEQRPNILFNFSDDHAAHAIGAYGSKINKTPSIDRLAREGMLFRNAFCGNAICSPSRATILTGKHSHMNGVYNVADWFDSSQQTFPKLLQQAGYQTALVGKWHLASDPTGFDYWNILVGQGPYYNPPMIENGGKTKHTGYTTDIITDITLDWLKQKRGADKPFMLMYQHKSPHRPWDPDSKHFQMYEDETIPEPENLFDTYENRSDAARDQKLSISKDLNNRDLKFESQPNLTPEQQKAWDDFYGPLNRTFENAKLEGDDLVRWKYQRYIKDYLRCVASMDDNIGRVLDYLDESGLAKNTVVIYSSDQGFFLGDHDYFDKRFMYEESMRMPLIIRWPGVTKAGVENKELVQNIDYAQTFLDIAGVTSLDDMQGRSIVPLLKGENPSDWRTSLYYHYYEQPSEHNVERHYGVRTDRYKLISFYDTQQWELFDLEKDPHEMKSVYDDPAYAKTREELTAELKRLQAEVKEADPDIANDVLRSKQKALREKPQPAEAK
ncbi:MAG: sulfatase [Chthoniobacterales bacterium]|nr:sulfatase [Chthoniobacterales bacterium]